MKIFKPEHHEQLQKKLAKLGVVITPTQTSNLFELVDEMSRETLKIFMPWLLGVGAVIGAIVMGIAWAIFG